MGLRLGLGRQKLLGLFHRERLRERSRALRRAQSLHRIDAEAAMAHQPAVQAAPRRQRLGERPAGKSLRVQQPDEPPQPRRVERFETRVRRKRAQKAKCVSVAFECRRRQAPLVPQRVEIRLYQLLVRMRGRCALRHALWHYSLAASAPATNSPMRRRNSVPISP
jgi:hypothetical protein